jgi:hypothetical protein
LGIVFESNETIGMEFDLVQGENPIDKNLFHKM